MMLIMKFFRRLNVKKELTPKEFIHGEFGAPGDFQLSLNYLSLWVLIFICAVFTQFASTTAYAKSPGVVELSNSDIASVVACDANFYFDAASGALHLNDRSIVVSPLKIDAKNQIATFSVAGKYGPFQARSMRVRLQREADDRVRWIELSGKSSLNALKTHIESKEGSSFFEQSPPEGPDPLKSFTTYQGSGKGEPPFLQIGTNSSKSKTSWLQCSYRH